ncbi:MAG: hypothetical protein U0527_14070 [Candidatus Eisenbacteria bacterium]
MIALPFALVVILHLAGAAIALPFRIGAPLQAGRVGARIGARNRRAGLRLLFGAFFGLGLGVVGIAASLAIPLLPILAIIFLWRALRRRQPTPGGTQQGMW